MELGSVIKIIRARRWLVLLPTIVVLVGTVTFSVLQPSVYRGEATVLVTQQNAGTTLIGSPQLQQDNDVQTQALVMQSPRIAGLAIHALGLHTTPTDLLKRVVVSTEPGTNMVAVAVTDTSAYRAAATANAVAQAYVTWSEDTQRSSIKAAADDVARRLALSQKDIVGLEAKLAVQPTSGDLQVRLQAAKDLYASLSDKLEQLRINQQLETGSGTILTEAVADTQRVSPVPVRDGAIGLAVGLMLGLGLAFLVETLDNTIKTSDEAAEIYGVPVLANVPAEKAKTKGAAHLAAVQNPGGRTAEAYRSLRNNLDFVNFEHKIKTVLITSPVPSEGKSTVAASLAVVLSQTGKDVVLVVCDFHRPASTRYFDVDNSLGLSDVLVGSVKLEAAVQRPVGWPGLRVLPAGKLPPNPSELLGSPAMGHVIRTLRESSADWVIVDSAPLLAVADAAATVRWVDGVLVVTLVGVSTREAARKGREQLENVGARTLGVAVLGIKKSESTGSYYGYSDHNGQ